MAPPGWSRPRGGEGGGALSGDNYSYRLLGGYRFGDRYSVEATRGLMPEIGEKFEIFAVHGIAAMSFSRIGLYGGAGYYEASFDKGIPLQSDDFEIPGIGTADLSGVSDHEHRDDRGVTVIGGVRLDLGRGSLRAEYEWLDTSSAFAASGVNLLFLIRF
ncbi:MAG TPA: hypothetical protein VF329_07325 [Gammaproteobacteria bacterium]